MDVRFINPFIQSVKNVFSTMLATDLLVNRPFVKVDDRLTSDVSAVIGLSGDAVGCVALCFPMETAAKVAGQFAGIEMSKEHEDFADALGELANMVAGGAKAKLDGFTLRISLPNVVVGRNHVISHSSQTPRLVLPCDAPLGRFSVEVVLLAEKATANAKAQSAAAGA